MKSAVALVFACVAGTALAACPNKCSGHGACGSSDQCTCEPRYTGADCNERTCAYGLSWTAEKQVTDIVPAGRGLGGVHAYTECSSMGTCNRGSGLCECFEGFTGLGCRRTTCLNDCSGHGRCQTLRQTNSSYVAYHAAQFASQFWNANMTRRCTCDAGWQGRDCSARVCPKGDDPLTDCKTDSTTFQGRAHEQIQRIYVVHKSNEAGAGLCGHTGASTSASLVDNTPPGYQAYASCYLGQITAKSDGKITGKASPVATSALPGAGLIAETNPDKVKVSLDDKVTVLAAQTVSPRYITVYPQAGTVAGRTFPISSVAADGTCTLDTAFGAIEETDHDAAFDAYIVHSRSGIVGDTPIVGCPKSGPYSYQDQTDGRFAKGNGDIGVVVGTSSATAAASVAGTIMAGRGCEPGNPTALSVGGHQLGYIALTYTDMYGSRYTTRPILIDSTVASTQDSTQVMRANQYKDVKMMDYNGCASTADCRGTPLLMTCSSGTCGQASGATLEAGGSHPHWEGPVDRDADALGTPAESGRPDAMLVTLASSSTAKIKLAASTPAAADDAHNGHYITIMLGSDASTQGTYRITDWEETDNFIDAYEFVYGVDKSHVAHNAGGLGAAGNYYYAHKLPSAGNFDTWRTPNRLLYTADRIRSALQELPNFAIPKINVTNHVRMDTGELVGNIFDVTFTDAATPGQQNMLECIYSTGYNNPGAWPKMGNTANTVSDTSVESCVVQDIYMGTKQYEENVACSNRGTCDSSSGVCTCYEGFTGEACSTQTIFF